MVMLPPGVRSKAKTVRQEGVDTGVQEGRLGPAGLKGQSLGGVMMAF